MMNTPVQLGTLEEKVMKHMWESGPQTVREVKDGLGVKKSAYTTIMTTMDRLFKKGLLSREKDGLAYIYQPAVSESEFQQAQVSGTVTALLSESGNVSPVLAAFVDAAVSLDEENLQTLEALIAQHRTGSGK